MGKLKPLECEIKWRKVLKKQATIVNRLKKALPEQCVVHVDFKSGKVLKIQTLE